MTAREIADLLAERVYAITRECGRPIVLSVEDREALAAVIEADEDNYIDSPTNDFAMPEDQR